MVSWNQTFPKSGLKTQARFNLVMNGFWCSPRSLPCLWGSGLLPGRSSAGQFIVSFISGQKTSRRSDIHLRRKGLNLWRQNVGCWNSSRSTTNIISATLATSSLALPGWNTIWVGPSPRSLRLNKKATRVRQSTQLLLTQFETLLAPGGGIAQLQSDRIRINHAWV